LCLVDTLTTLGLSAPLAQSIPHNSLFLWQKSTLLACILPLIIFFNQLLSKPRHLCFAALNVVIFIVAAGFVFVTSSHLFVIFFSFELLLLSSLYLLRLTAKSERIGEAVTEMFF
jgi:NADH:ubiquinone oxidoreductase subunit 2 (subunit N)